MPSRRASPSEGGGALGPWETVPGRPGAFASWRRKMDRWEAPRMGGNQGGGVGPLRDEGGAGAAVRGSQGAPGRPPGPLAGVEDGAVRWEACARGRPGWWQGEGPRLDVYMYVCLWARGALSRVDFVDWGGRWCGSLSSTHSIYISTQCNDPRQKASLVVGGLRAPPGDAARGVASPRGRTGGLDASPCKGNLSMCSFNGRRLPGPSRPRGTIPLSL